MPHFEPTRQRSGSDGYLVNSRIPYILFDQNGAIVEWNSAADSLFPELAVKGNVERNIRNMILGFSSAEDIIKFEYLISSDSPHFEFDFARPKDDGTFQWFRTIIDRREDKSFFALLNEITAQKLKETHLVNAKETAEKASIERSQFLANISHEIRTPIQTIMGMMELLSDTKLDEEQTEYARQVSFSADVMLTLINDILDISKAEAGQMKIEIIDFDIYYVIERTVDLVSMEAHRKGLEVCTDIDPSVPVIVRGDPGRLQQVLLNLIKNAVKFTEAGQILVSARIIRRDEVNIENKSSRAIRFEVCDTGIGIKPEVQNQLFTQFFQGDSSTTRKYGGTGLGLAISKNIVQLMKGDIGVKSNTPHGAIFWFELPFLKSDRQQPVETLPLNPGTRFLVVDDNRQSAEIIIRMLASLGYHQTGHAESGMFALAMLRSACQAKRPFDIVLVDMLMPEMDGWRLAAEIHGNSEINQTQLYLMVPEGGFGADAKMKLLEWFNGYLYKPVKRRKLVELLKDHWQASTEIEGVEEVEELDELGEIGDLEPIEDTDMEAVNEPLPAHNLTVLVAEDHPVNSKLLKIFLEKEGASVLLAEDGQQAIELIAAHHVDFIFMDIQMPRMNGYEAASWMRKHGYNQPIIACTASAQEGEKEKCLSFGMNDILPKPYRRQEVADILKQAKDTLEHGDIKMTPRTENGSAIFDADSFFDIMSGDFDAARDLVREYLAQTREHMTLLAEDIRNKDFESATQAAHLIKGSSMNVTASRFAEAARAIEKNAKNADAASLANMEKILCAELETLIGEFKKTGYLA